MTNNNLRHVNAEDLDRINRDGLWDIKTVATYVGVTERTVRTWCQDGRLSYMKIGRTLRFRPDGVDSDLSRFEIKANR